MFAAKTDAELCEASAQGQAEAFEALVRRYQGAVCAVTYAATGRRELSEDLAQEAFLIAWKKLPGIADPERVGGWLVGIARNLARKSRRVRVDQPLEHPEALEGEVDMEETVLERESRAQVWALLKTLPAKYREVLVLYYREGQSAPRVAEQLGITTSAAEQRLSRGRKLLRDKVDRAMERELTRTAPTPAFARRVAAALPAVQVAATGSAAGITPWLAALGKAIIMKKFVVFVVAAALAVLGYAAFASRDQEVQAESPSSVPPKALAKRAETTQTRSDGARTGVDGRVAVAGSGDPAAGAVVTITTPGGVPARTRKGGGAPAIVPVNAEGVFAVEGLAPGRYVAAASAPGYQPTAPVHFEVRAEAMTHLALSVAAGGIRLSGTATDIGGGPVHGAVIRAVGGGRSYAAVADDDGRYALNVPRGGYELVAWDDDYERQARFISVSAGPQTVDFQLVPAASISGRVVERDSGAPVPGAVVSFEREIRGVGSFSSDSAGTDETAVAGPDGRFTLRRLSAANYQVYAYADHLASRAPAEVTVGIAENFDGLVVAVDPAFNVRGRVFDVADASVALAGIEVQLYGQPSPPAVVSAEDGSFEVLGVLSGDYPLAVQGEGVVSSMMELKAKVSGADVTDLEVPLDRGTEVCGVLEPRKVADVRVRSRKEIRGLEAVLKGSTVERARAQTLDDGEFCISAVPAGDWKVVGEGSDGSLGEVDIEVEASRLTDVRVPMAPRPAVRGRVVGRDGANLAGLTVDLVPDHAEGGRQAVLWARFGAKKSVTDEAGSFALVGLDAGAYRLSIVDARGVLWTPAGRSAEDPSLTLEVPGEGIDGLELVVEEPRGVISGVVRGEDGPLADAWVTLWVEAQEAGIPEHPTTVTDAAGRFEFRQLPEGEFTLRASSELRDASGELAGVAPGEDVDLMLESLGRIAGTVTFDGRPVRQFDVRAGGIQRRFVAEDGRFEIARLSPGKTRVVVTAAPGSIVEPIELDPGQSARLDLELGAWGSVTGRAVYADGTPAAGLPIDWSMKGGELDRSARLTRTITGDGAQTDAEGRFSIEGLGAGPGSVRFGSDGIMGSQEVLGEVKLSLEAGEALDLGEVTLR